MHAPAGAESARPAARAVARRRRRADVADARAHQRAHGRVAPHVGARDVVLRDRPHAHRAHPRRSTAPSSRRTTGEKLTLPAVHHQGRRRRAQAVPGAERGGARQQRSSTASSTTSASPSRSTGASSFPSSRTPTTSRSPASRARSTISPSRARAKRLEPRRSAGRRRSRSPIPASSARSWARRSSQPQVAHPRTRRDREAAEGHHRSRWRGHDRHSHLRVLLALVRSPHRRRRGRRPVPRRRQAARSRRFPEGGAVACREALTIATDARSRQRAREFRANSANAVARTTSRRSALLGVRGSRASRRRSSSSSRRRDADTLAARSRIGARADRRLRDLP